MASFLCGHEVFQITASATYGLVEFKADLLALYAKAGGKGTKVTFLLTDTNIVNERFLVYINDLLSTGYIADLCTPVCPFSPPSTDFITVSGHWTFLSIPFSHFLKLRLILRFTYIH